MLIINFIKDSDRKDLLGKIEQGLQEYQDIWDKDGNRIIEAIESISGLKFKENEINAIVYVSSLNSRSFPLSLIADIPLTIKPGLLVHELCHRILSGNRLIIRAKKYKDLSLEIHKVLNLIFYDILIDLYGEKKTKKTIKWESSSRSAVYKDAWNWVLSFNKETRSKKFKNFMDKQSLQEKL